MNSKKILQAFFLILVLVFSVALIIISIKARQKYETKPTSAEGANKPEYKPADNQADASQWTEYTHPELKYSFRYPQELTVEKRGKVGNLEDLLALNYSKNGKHLTIVKIQLTNGAPKEKTVITQKGKDTSGNEVFIFIMPYHDTKTLTLIGTIYPTEGSDFRFEEVIQKIAQTIKI